MEDMRPIDHKNNIDLSGKRTAAKQESPAPLPRKKITFLVLHLGFGGVEKAVASQVGILCEKYDVEILCAYRLYDTPPFPIDERVKITYLLGDLKPNRDEFAAALRSKNPFAVLKEGLRSVKVLIKRTSAMKRALKKLDSDLVISTRILYNKLLCRHHPRGAVLAAQEHRHHNNDKRYIRKLLASVRGMDWFLPVSQELTDFYGSRLAGSGVKCAYIPHCLDAWPDHAAPLEGERLISVGRLSYEKGFDDLAELFAEILKACPGATLDLIGDGDQRPLIEQKAAELGLGGRFILHGYRKKDYIDGMLEQASVFLMSSREESFGIALLEAQAHGLPCVAFDSAQGAKEIIHDGEDGFLIARRDKARYCAAVVSLLRDAALRARLGEKARLNAAAYRRETIAEKWYTFCEKALEIKKS